MISFQMMVVAESVRSHIEEAKREITGKIIQSIESLQASGQDFIVEFDQYLGHRPKDKRTVKHFWEGLLAYYKPTWRRYSVSSEGIQFKLLQADDYKNPEIIPETGADIELSDIPFGEFSFKELETTAKKIDGANQLLTAVSSG